MLVVVTIIATFLYNVEANFTDDPTSVVQTITPPITNIPLAFYWTIITVTTVGHGDYVPQTW
jgi:voltage-gated potassium channel Kch